jgi:AcrR family transcriptional regulator
VTSPRARQPTPAGTRRRQQKAETRAVILGSARTLFEEEGFEKTTVRHVAADAGVALGTIFAHFPDKESLLIAALIDDLNQTYEEAWATMPQDVTLLDKLLHLARGSFEAWARRPALSRVLVREMCFTPGPGRQQLRSLDQRAMTRIAGLVEEARQRKEVRADTDPELVTKTAFAFLLTVLFQEFDDLDDGEDGTGSMDVEPMVALARRFLKQMFNGIGNVEASPSLQKPDGRR